MLTSVILVSAALLVAGVWLVLGGLRAPANLTVNADHAATSSAPHASTLADISITGMTCASCVSRVERALKSVPGVRQATVSLMANQGTVEYDSTVSTMQDLTAAVYDSGYDAAEMPAGLRAPGDKAEDSDALRIMRLRLVTSAILTAPVLAGSMGMDLHLPIPMILSSAWVQLALTAPVLFWCGWPFTRGAWAALRHRASDMNTLITLGAGSAWFYSALVTVQHPAAAMAGAVPVYFETAGVIVTLILLGRTLEARARSRAGEAMRALLAIVPVTARLVTTEGEAEIPADEVKVGSLLRLRPGDRAPVDGVVTDGRTAMDESLVTGESVTVEKSAGSEIVAGSIAREGTLIYQATLVGSNTTIARIIGQVRSAQATRAPIQRLADRITAIFVPSVLSLAIISGAVWLVATGSTGHAMSTFVAVLIIACPCALGLATPTSVMVGIGRGAQAGVLIRNAEALERTAGVRVVALDKTGTLTIGRPVLKRCVPLAEFSEDEVLTLAASAEVGSEHPLADAIVTAAKERRLNLSAATEFRSVPGQGIFAEVSGRKVLAGTESFMVSQGVSVESVITGAKRLASDGSTTLFVAVDAQPAGIMVLGDQIRGDSAQAIAGLKLLGVKTVMITGDGVEAANAVASMLGVEGVVARAIPSHKRDEVLRLEREVGPVAMVGDGVNDAPALAQATVGVAMGHGADVAMEAADITLLSGSIAAMPDAIALARATMRNIKQNLAFAFLYNVLGIPLAAGVFYPLTHQQLSPMLASGAMAMSSVSVVTNALRLRLWKPAITVNIVPETAPELTVSRSA